MELLLTFFGIVLAVYAIAPRFRQYEFLLKLGRFSLGILIFGTGLAIFFEFYEFFYGVTGPLLPWQWPEGLTPEKAINIVILFLITFFSFRTLYPQIPKHGFNKQVQHLRQ